MLIVSQPGASATLAQREPQMLQQRTLLGKLRKGALTTAKCFDKSARLFHFMMLQEQFSQQHLEALQERAGPFDEEQLLLVRSLYLDTPVPPQPKRLFADNLTWPGLCLRSQL